MSRIIEIEKFGIHLDNGPYETNYDRKHVGGGGYIFIGFRFVIRMVIHELVVKADRGSKCLWRRQRALTPEKIRTSPVINCDLVVENQSVLLGPSSSSFWSHSLIQLHVAASRPPCGYFFFLPTTRPLQIGDHIWWRWWNSPDVAKGVDGRKWKEKRKKKARKKFFKKNSTSLLFLFSFKGRYKTRSKLIRANSYSLDDASPHTTFFGNKSTLPKLIITFLWPYSFLFMKWTNFFSISGQ